MAARTDVQETGPADLRSILAHIPTSVAAVGAMTPEGPVSFVASTFVGISLAPPIVALSFQKSSERWPRLQGCDQLGITILAHHHDHRTRQLAASGANTYDGVQIETGERGAIFIRDGVVGLACRIDRVVEAGDHDIALLAVDRVVPLTQAEPLVFHRSKFRRLAPDHMAAADWLSGPEWQ
jgi:flavin reductase (DIM6/NTAB) family NADH-FMN oxidoreductase RutF